MKKICVAVTALLAAGVLAFAEGTFMADDLNPSDSVTEKIELNGFTINASKEKEVRIMAKKKTAPDGTRFTRLVDLRGAPASEARTITFSAKAGETVVVYGNSGSKEDKRTALVQNADTKTTITSISLNPQAGKVSMGEVKIPEDGNYQVCSEKGGIYIYGIIVK
ncbi:MAG: hypothetical protein K2H73_05915 [Treponemataceae bacterium]|nr:hypothetical protein [Treponemataceae bacterium]